MPARSGLRVLGQLRISMASLMSTSTHNIQFDSCHNGTASRHSAQQRTQQAFYVVITPQLLITADIYRQRKLQQMNFVDRHSHRRQFHKQVLREIGLATHPNLVQLVVLASAAQYLAQIALLQRPDRPVLATGSPLLVQATRCEHGVGVVVTAQNVPACPASDSPTPSTSTLQALRRTPANPNKWSPPSYQTAQQGANGGVADPD